MNDIFWGFLLGAIPITWIGIGIISLGIENAYNRSCFILIYNTHCRDWFNIFMKICAGPISLFDVYLLGGFKLKLSFDLLVPRGRGPFKSWEDGARDALHFSIIKNPKEEWFRREYGITVEEIIFEIDASEGPLFDE
jgi:hypothetical protein